MISSQDTALLLEKIDSWIRQRRWFPGDAHSQLTLLAASEWSIPHIDDADLPEPGNSKATEGHSTGDAPASDRVVSLHVAVDGSILFVPIVMTCHQPENTDSIIASDDEGWIVDGPQHPSTIRAWVARATAQNTIETQLAHELLASAPMARMLTGEQSNSSVYIPLSSGPHLLKFFRTLQVGIHPELEVTSALGQAGWTHVSAPQAHTLAAIRDSHDADATALEALLSPFITDVVDGYGYFKNLAARNQDPSTDAFTLGEVIASMHDVLTEAFGAAPSPHGHQIAQRIRNSIEAAASEVPRIDSTLVRDLFAAVEPLEHVDHLPDSIRIHGDLHLGQTLVGSRWYVLDFEGEPMRPLEERRVKDFRARDIAGMLRSFAYAAAQAQHEDSSQGVVGDGDVLSHQDEAVRWEQRACEAFLEGYRAHSGDDSMSDELLRALLIEKAVYETVYEQRFRPSWVEIPLRALRSLTQ